MRNGMLGIVFDGPARLQKGVEDAVRRNVEFRQAQKAFIERGLASSEVTKKSGKYVSSAAVLGKLSRRLNKARKECRSTT